MSTRCPDPLAPARLAARGRRALPLLAAATAVGSLGLAAGQAAASLLVAA